MRGIKGLARQHQNQPSQYPWNGFTVCLALLSLLVAPLDTVVAGAATSPGTYGLSKLTHRQGETCEPPGDHCCFDAQSLQCYEGTCVPKDGSLCKWLQIGLHYWVVSFPSSW